MAGRCGTAGTVPEQHHVTVTSRPAWLVEQLGVDATLGMRRRDWLLTPQQRLLGVVAGAVYADDTGALTRVRRELGWYLGTAFARLEARDDLGRRLADAVHAGSLPQREAALGAAYVALAHRHNHAELTAPVDPALRPYHRRPAQVLMADRFADACLATVETTPSSGRSRSSAASTRSWTAPTCWPTRPCSAGSPARGARGPVSG